jgi:hypothetical protein
VSARPAYGVLDRLLHEVAFNRTLHGIELQKTLAGVEDSMLGRNLAAGSPPQPVFVTALPRAGTTLLLSLLAALPDFATHTYRDMPFVLTPLLWNRLSRAFRKPTSAQERAHGDGVLVGYDSPEAFEEVLWMAFWRGKYHATHIDAWTPADRDPDFERFFARHMRKVIAARAGGDAPRRYLSKNNANIARLALLPRLFPDCRIVVPLRDPWSHARSLRHQHERFTRIHADNRFARQYMGWLGHFEFGADLRPIRFPGKAEGGISEDPAGIDFWLRYWIAAHEAILGTDAAPNLVIVDYATLCAEPRSTLETLGGALDIENRDELSAMADGIRRPTAYASPDGEHDPTLMRRATELYRAMREDCINRPPRRQSSSTT